MASPSLNLTGTGFHSYVSLKFQYTGIADTTKIESIVVSYNDSNATIVDGNTASYSFASTKNDEWSTYELSPSEIASGRTRINGLDVTKSYNFKAVMIYYDSNDVVNREWSNQELISLQRKPVGVVLLQDEDGKDTQYPNNYIVTVEYGELFYQEDRKPEKIIFLLQDTALVGSEITKQEFPVNAFGSVNYTKYTLTGLSAEKMYEVSCITVRGLQSTLSTSRTSQTKYGSVSTSILISTSARPTQPTKPTIIFDYVNGGVTLNTGLFSIGAGDGEYFFYILQVLNGAGEPIKEIQSANLITTTSTDDDLKSFSFNTLNDNYFTTGSTYKVRFMSQNSNDSSTGRNVNNTDTTLTFQILKKAVAPVVEVYEVLENQQRITFKWNQPEVYNGTVTDYVLNLRTDPSGATVKTFSYNGSLTNAITYTTPANDLLTVGTKYYASVYAVIDNSVNNSNSGESATLDGNESSKSSVYATPYNTPGATTLSVKYDVNNVDKKAVFDITGVPDFLTQSGLTFEKLVISKRTTGAYSETTLNNITNLQGLLNLLLTNLINGTPYEFKVNAFVTTGTSVSNTLLQGKPVQGSDSNVVSFVPWKTPSVPVIANYDEGNHFIEVTLTDSNNSSESGVTGLKYFDLGTVATNQNIKVYYNALNLYGYIYYNLENGTLYQLPCSAVYENPNFTGDTSKYIVVAGVAAEGTPVFTTAPYQPTGVTASTISDGQVTVSFTAPDLNIVDTRDQLVLVNYTVHAHLKDVNGVFNKINSPSYPVAKDANPLEVVIDNLLLGSEYKFTVVANYTDSVDSPKVESALSNAKIPYEPANAPSIGSVQIGDTQLTVEIIEPSLKGGLDIQYYKINYSLNADGSSPGTKTTTTSGLTQVIDALINGNAYYVAARAVTYVPQSSTPLEGELSAYTTSSYTPVPGSLPSVLNFRMTKNGYDVTDGQNNQGKIELSWDAINSFGIGSFDYELQQVDSGNNLIPDTLLHTTNTNTSIEISNLTLGATYKYVIRVKAVDPNSSGNFLYGSDSASPISVVPFDGTVAKVNGVKATGAPVRIDVEWTATSTIGGAQVDGYNVYLRESNSGNTLVKQNPVLLSASPFQIIGLLNGTSYDLCVTYQFTIDSVVYESSKEDGKYMLATAIPFDGPTAATISIDDQVAFSQRNVITITEVSSANGSAVTGYELYEDDAKLLSTEYSYNSTNRTFTRSGRTNGTPYKYFVKPLYKDLNKSNPDVYLEGPKSNEKTKIPFRADTAPSIKYVQNMGDAANVKVFYDFTHDTTTGLTESTKKLYMVVNNGTTHVLAGPSYGELILSNTNLSTIEMYSSYDNPNSQDYPKVDSSRGTFENFIAYGKPSVSSFETLLEGNQTVRVGLTSTDLATNGGSFQNYIVNVYEEIVNGGVTTYQLVQGPFSNLTSRTSQLNVTGLTNSKRYKFEAQAVVSPQYDGLGTSTVVVNFNLTSDAINAYGTPTESNIPQIISVIPSILNNKTYVVKIQTNFEDILRLILFVTPIYEVAPLFQQKDNQELYYQVGFISKDYASADGTIDIPIQLNSNITVGDVQGIACIAMSNDGPSNTFFSPASRYNNLAGGLKNYAQVAAPYAP